ncbi:sulfotransferase [Actinomadura sp. NBRC 104425]|nr:sulfotransferase [Actinomadura sp. NBRC 104425]
MPIAWVASYPKSGNTWARILLASYLRDDEVRIRVNEMGILDEAVTDLVDMFQQGRLLPLDHPRTLAVKTHFLPGAEVQRRYRSATGKVLYIIRNPRDVIYSNERFLHVGEKHRTAFARHFIEHRGVDAWRRVGFGTWPQNVLEWTSPQRLHRHFPDADVCVIRYEDMKHDTAASLHKMIDFLGFDNHIDPDRVQRAVRNSTLDRLREQERGDRSRRPGRNPFFGQGLSGQSLSGYGEDVEEAYLRLLREDEEFAGLAERYGYAQ